TVHATVQTSPARLSFAVDGTSYTSPQLFFWTPGSHHTIGTTSPQTLGGTQYQWNSWSDGGPMTHDVVAPTRDITYTANFSTPAHATLQTSPTCASVRAARTNATSPPPVPFPPRHLPT